MSGRIRAHLRSNVIGYVALFFAMTASAVALPGTDTVFSDDITNGEVKSVDIGNGQVQGPDLADNSVAAGELTGNSVGTSEIIDGEVRSPDIADNNIRSEDVRDDTTAGGGLAAADLAAGSVGSSEVIDESLAASDLATDSVQATEVADNSLDSGEIIDFGLSNEDIGVLEAEVNADGTLASSDHFGTTSASLGTGSYQVDFGINVSFCTPVVTQGEAGVGGAGGAIAGVTDRAANANAFFVTTRDAAGSGINTAFHLVVVC